MKVGAKYFIAAIASVSLVACTSTGEVSKEGWGTGIGAVTGAVLGAAIGGKKGALIGGGLGGLAGNRIGAGLDKRDQLALAERTEDALNNAAIGETVVWKSDHTDAIAEITPIKNTVKENEATFTLHETSVDRETSTALNVREGPGASYSVKQTLLKGSKVSTHGVTENGWYRVGNGTEIIGYVHGSYLRAIVGESSPNQGISKNEGKEKYTYSEKEQSQPTPVRSEEVTVIANINCKMVRVRTKVNGEVREQEVETCQAPNGSWGA